MKKLSIVNIILLCIICFMCGYITQVKKASAWDGETSVVRSLESIAESLRSIDRKIK